MLKPNPKRDAWSTIRGFVYQVDLSIRAWINLKDNQHLKLEFFEDIDIVDEIEQANGNIKETLELTQAKYRESKIKLYTNSLLESFLNYYELFKNDKNKYKLQYCTNADIEGEQPINGESLNEKGILIWQKINQNQPIIDEHNTLLLIKKYLTEKSKDSKIRLPT